MKHATRRARQATCLAVITIATGVVLSGMASGRAGANCSQFAATAAADGARTSARSSLAAILGEIDSEGPAAQVHVDALGTSSAWAGAPYPGTAGSSLLGMAGVPVAYPLMATSSSPTKPEDEVTGPGLTLTAQSERSAGRAHALVGGSSGADADSAASANAETEAGCTDDGTVSAHALSEAEGARFADGALVIARVRSVATVVVDPNGERRVDSSMEAGEITVFGQRVVLSDDGLQAGESTVGLVDTAAVRESLARSGVHVSYLAAVEQPDGNGVMAPGLRVDVVNDEGATSYTFGRAYAAADASAPLPVPGSGGQPSRVPAPAADATPSPGAPALSPVLDEEVASGASSTPAAGPESSAPVLATLRIPELDLASLYPAIVAGVSALLVGGWILRRLGVRS